MGTYAEKKLKLTKLAKPRIISKILEAQHEKNINY